MEYRYKTTINTYDKDFDKAVNHFPKEFHEKYTINLKLNVAKNLTLNQAAHILTFIIKSIEIGDENEVEYEICTDENLENDAAEVILYV